MMVRLSALFLRRTFWCRCRRYYRCCSGPALGAETRAMAADIANDAWDNTRATPTSTAPRRPVLR